MPAPAVNLSSIPDAASEREEPVRDKVVEPQVAEREEPAPGTFLGRVQVKPFNDSLMTGGNADDPVSV